MPAATRNIKAIPVKLIFSFAIILLLVMSALLLSRIDNMRQASQLVNHSNIVRLALADVHSILKEAEAVQRGFLLTSDPSFLINYNVVTKNIHNQISYIRSLVSDNPTQVANVQELAALVNIRLQTLEKVFALQQKNTRWDTAFRSALEPGRLAMKQVENQIRKMNRLEADLLKVRNEASRHFIFTTPIYTVVLTLLALLIIIAAFNRLTRQLQVSEKYRTKNEQAVAEQQKTHTLFEKAEQAAGLGSWKWDAATNEVIHSDNLIRLFGYNPDETQPLLNDVMPLILPQGQSSGNQEQPPAAAEEKKVKECWLPGKDGGERYYRFISWFFLNEKGERTGIGTVQDITEEYLLKQQLQQRTEFSETLVDNSVSMIAVIDTEMRYTIWNKACEERFGLKRAEVLGRHLLDVFSFVREDPRLKYIRAGLDEGIATYKKELPYIEGKRIAEFSYIPLKNADGNIMGLLIMIHDVTEKIQANNELKRLNQELEEIINALQESEAFNRHITEMAPNAIYVYDFNAGNNVYTNRKAHLIHGYSEEEMAGMGSTLLHHTLYPEDLPRVQEHHAKLQQANDDEIIDFEYRIRHKSGETRYQYAREAPFKRNEQGAVEQIIGVAVDITELKKAQEKLLELNRELTERNLELQHSNEELASFNYIASHDLQEPLRKIQTFSNFIEEREAGLSPAGKTYLKRMQTAASRMRSLISDLLSFSRAREAKEHLGPVDLNLVLKQAQATLKAAIDEKEAVIQSDRLPVVEGVSFQLQQLFENLIGNSIKYSAPGTAPFIHITCERVAPENLPAKKVHPDQVYYRISFKDNGIGFEQEYAERIFELFQRLHSKDEYSGTGIGLAICKKIVQNHGGTIMAHSEPEHGATFDVYLPVGASGR